MRCQIQPPELPGTADLRDFQGLNRTPRDDKANVCLDRLHLTLPISMDGYIITSFTSFTIQKLQTKINRQRPFSTWQDSLNLPLKAYPPPLPVFRFSFFFFGGLALPTRYPPWSSGIRPWNNWKLFFLLNSQGTLKCPFKNRMVI